MQLKPVGRPMERNKRSEINKPYSIAHDVIYLYLKPHNTHFEVLINGVFYGDECRYFDRFQAELEEALLERQLRRRGDNRKKSYRCIIYTNDIIRASSLIYKDDIPEEQLYKYKNKSNNNKVYKVITEDCPIILKSISQYIPGDITEGEGVYKLQTIMEFIKDISNKKSIHQVKCTIGSNIESMESIMINHERKNNANKINNKFYWPRLFNTEQMKKVDDRTLIRNYNLLQCSNMAGLINLSECDTYKVLDNIISLDIKSAYLSAMLTECIFPKDLTVIDIPTSKIDYLGDEIEFTDEEVIDSLFKRIERFEKNNQWYYITIDPNIKDSFYEESNEYKMAMDIVNEFKYFRRGWNDKKDITLKYVNQEEVLCFTKWDLEFYDMFYQYRTHKSLIDMLLQLCQICHGYYNIVIMYSKNKMQYLPNKFRQEKLKLYNNKEKYEKGSWKRDISKLYTELTYGKGLQLYEFTTGKELKDHIYRETINIAMSITCCSYVRLRLIKDWEGFVAIYNDTDSVKLQFDIYTQPISKILERLEELNESCNRKLKISGMPEGIELGKWAIEGIWDKMLFLGKKSYICAKNNDIQEIKLAGCLKEAKEDYFKNKSAAILNKIAQEQKLIIPKGKRIINLLNNGYYEYYEYSDIIYQKKTS